MDKYEYKLRADEIDRLIKENKYKEAVEIADTIDWRNVKNNMRLCAISDLYKMCKRFEDSREVLLLAYERNPGGKLILYSLCELSIKLGDVLSAVEFYKEFNNVAPKDTGRFVLRYKLLTAQEVGLDERISVLEELQKYECKEKWMYELAYLYHMQGYSDKCIEECNQIVIYFGEGKYVIKALNLKQLHEPLSAEQDALLRRLTEPSANDILIKEMDVSKFNTIDLQKELASSMAEVLYDDTSKLPVKEVSEALESEDNKEAVVKDEPGDLSENNLGETQVVSIGDIDAEKTDGNEGDGVSSEDEFATKVIDTTKVNEEVSEELKEETRIFNIDEIESGLKNDSSVSRTIIPNTQSFFNGMTEVRPQSMDNSSVVFPDYDDMVSLEGDGQLSFNIPKEHMVEKQITGQISIDEVLAEWERMKNANEKKWRDDMRKKVIDKTTDLLKDFEESSHDGLLEKLETEISESAHVELTKEEEEILTNEGLAIEIVESAPVSEEEVLEAEEIIEETEPSEADEEPQDEVIEEIDQDIREIVISEEDEEPVETEDVLPTEEVVEEPVSEDPTPEELSFDRTEYTKEELENTDELSQELTGKEPESLDNTAVIPDLENIGDYLLAFAAAGDEHDKIDEEALSGSNEGKEEASEEIATDEADTEADSNKDEEPEEEQLETPYVDSDENTEYDAENEDSSEDEIRESGFTEAQEERFEEFIQTEEAREQLKEALANISMENGHGNVIIGSEDIDSSVELAKAIMVELSAKEGINGKVAKIKASTLNAKDAEETLSKLFDGALIIQDAQELRKETLEAIRKTVKLQDKRIFIILTTTKRAKHHFIMDNRDLLESFNVSIDIDALSNSELVGYAKGYAYSKEFSIDEMGTLALHTRIDEKQTNEHSVTIKEVKEIVDSAIAKASKKNVKHFVDILVGKRYDDNSMVVLTEKDFS